MPNDTIVETFRPQDGLSTTAQLFGGVTVDEIRAELAGLAGNNDETLIMRVGRWLLADGWERGEGEGMAHNRRRLMDIWWGPANHGDLTWRSHRSKYDSFPKTRTESVASLAEAVDQLAVWGVLPAEFSSLYAAGRADRAVERAA